MKYSPLFSFQWLLFGVIIAFSTAVSPKRIPPPSLSPTRGTILLNPDILLRTHSKDLKTFFYEQTLDHFSYTPESYTTFKHRYVMNFKYWGGGKANAPIFAYLGAEAPIDSDLAAVGFLDENASKFKALIVFIEHRYYGKSVPLGPFDDVLKNASARGYFTSAQALADYAEIILHIKEKYNAKYSPVIVIGGSYGGMLAAWFRLKYPHAAIGALASSAPILSFIGITPTNAFLKVVTKDFRQTSETCYRTIIKSWHEMEKIISKGNGLSKLSKIFRTCKPLTDASELFSVLFGMYRDAAQYERPPIHQVAQICHGIDGHSFGTDALSKVFAGLVAFKGNNSCYINEPNVPSELGHETVIGWSWQTCSDILISTIDTTDTMFPEIPFDLKSYSKDCAKEYRVPPRPSWATTYYGGHDIKLVLKRFGSNIIFANGLRDPWSPGSVLENLSDTLLAVNTIKGSHCLDLAPSHKSDPDWLIKQRETEVKIFQGWLAKYYADLKALKP